MQHNGPAIHLHLLTTVRFAYRHNRNDINRTPVLYKFTRASGKVKTPMSLITEEVIGVLTFLIAGLVSRAIIQVGIDGDEAREVARYDMVNRIREVEQGPDGAIWVLEDRDGGRLLKLTPRGDSEAD